MLDNENMIRIPYTFSSQRRPAMDASLACSDTFADTVELQDSKPDSVPQIEPFAGGSAGCGLADPICLGCGAEITWRSELTCKTCSTDNSNKPIVGASASCASLWQKSIKPKPDAIIVPEEPAKKLRRLSRFRIVEAGHGFEYPRQVNEPTIFK